MNIVRQHLYGFIHRNPLTWKLILVKLLVAIEAAEITNIGFTTYFK